MKCNTDLSFCCVVGFYYNWLQKHVNQNSSGPGKDELLTEKIWRLISYGRDANNNGLVDPSEEAIRTCEKDNSYVFAPGGSGLVEENSDVCPGGNVSSSFHWSFVNNSTGLDFSGGVAAIIKLTETSMILSDQSTSSDRLILMYGH